jgi:hypothetical protein
MKRVLLSGARQRVAPALRPAPAQTGIQPAAATEAANRPPWRPAALAARLLASLHTGFIVRATPAAAGLTAAAPGAGRRRRLWQGTGARPVPLEPSAGSGGRAKLRRLPAPCDARRPPRRGGGRRGRVGGSRGRSGTGAAADGRAVRCLARAARHHSGSHPRGGARAVAAAAAAPWRHVTHFFSPCCLVTAAVPLQSARAPRLPCIHGLRKCSHVARPQPSVSYSAAGCAGSAVAWRDPAPVPRRRRLPPPAR